MNSDEGNMGLFIGLLYLIAGIYSIIIGISFVNKTNLKNTGVYKFGLFLSKIARGEKKTLEADKETSNPENSTKYAVFSFLVGLFFLLAAVYAIFGT